MLKSERMDSIIELLEENRFLTVKYLCSTLHYSSATINRDLNALEQKGIISRAWGGIELAGSTAVPLLFRYEKSRAAKMRIAKAAANLIKDGDTVIIDGTTTTQYIGPYIAGKKDLHVITNNLALASFLSERNIWVTVLGGDIAEKPYMTDGEETLEMLMHYRADITLFSSSTIMPDGTIGDYEKIYWSLHKQMIKQAKRAYYMADREKIGDSVKYVICDLGDIRGIITDQKLSKELHNKYPHIRIIEAEENQIEKEKRLYHLRAEGKRNT